MRIKPVLRGLAISSPLAGSCAMARKCFEGAINNSFIFYTNIFLTLLFLLAFGKQTQSELEGREV